MQQRMPNFQVSDAGRVTIFLVHYGSKEYLRFVTERLLDHGFRIVAMDRPGYGYRRF